MSAPTSADLKALVTGGTCGIGPAAARPPAFRGARAACLGLTPNDVPEPLTGIRADVAATPWIGRPLDRAPDPEAERTALRARRPMRRLVCADEVATNVVHRPSPLSGSATGTALAVDGGTKGLRIRPRA